MHFQKATESLHIYDKINSYFQGITHAALSHEFTHFVEELSAEKFRKFTDVLFDVLGKSDVDVNRLIDAKEAVLRNTEEYKGRSEKELRAIAYSEAVAEMMEPVLTDTDAISRISQKIKQQDRSLWEKIKDFIKGIVEKLKAAYRDMEPDSAIARLTRETVTNSEAVLDAFSEAAADAVLNYNLQEGQKNNAREGERYSLREYTEQQKKNWGNSKRIVIYDNQEQLAQFISDSIANKTMDKKMYFGAIPSDLAARIKTDAGVDVEGFNLSLGSNEIRKILKDHGDPATEAMRGQRAITADDFAHIADIVLNPSNIVLSDQTYNGKPAIIFSGEYNGRMNVVAVVSNKRLDLFVQTVYANVKKGNLSTPTGEQAPINTPEANSSTVSNKTVAQSNAEVKGNFLKSSRDSAGNTLTEAQQRYFADSQVRDEDGNLIPVYHRTDGDFTVFLRGKLGGATLSNAADAGLAATSLVGHWFSDHDLGDLIGKNVVKSYLNIQNPYETDLISLAQEIAGFSSNPEMMQEHFENGQYNMVRKAAAEFTAWLRSEGYDGLKVTDQENGGVSYVVLDSRQAKLTTNQNPTGARDLRYSSRTASDSEYLNLAQNPEENREALSRMVENAAREAGYTRLFFHGSKKGGGFTVFRDWQYFTENREYAKRYANRENPGSLYETYVKMENPFDTRIPEVRELFEQARQEYGMGELQENGLPDWTDGYDIADYIDENDLPYDGIILDEGGDMVNGKPVSRGLSYVIRDSSQVKSADAVTYDDNGNVIPLSRRFDMGKEDIRYSSRTSSDSEYLNLAQNPEENELELKDMVRDAAEKAGFVYRRNARQYHSPQNDVGWQMFVYGIDNDQPKAFGSYEFVATDEGAIPIEDVMPKLRELTEEFYGEPISDDEINPPDIITSAGIFDDMEFMEFLYENYLNDLADENGGEYPAFITADGLMVFARDDKRVKSLAAVEYDDNGNVIPLSQRFDTGKEDIRYSARNPQAQAEAENERLKTELEYLKKLVQIQKRGNKDFTLDRNSLKKAARALMNANNVKGNVAELAEILDRVYRYAGTEPEITWERFAEQAGEAADWLMENRAKERDPYAQQILDAVAERRVSLNEAQIGEIEYRYGSLSEFKKAIKGSIILDQNANTSLDQLWQELSGEYPGTFEAGTTDADMPGAFADIVDELRDSESANEAERQYYADEERNQLIRQVYDGYWDVDPVQSVSDKAKKEIDLLKAEHREAIRELKAENRQLKSDAQSQVAAAVREYRQQNNAMTREMKKTYERQLKEVQKGYEKFRSQAESLSSESTLRYQNEFYNALMGTENLGKAKVPELRKKFRELAVENSGKDMDARKARQAEYTRLLDEFLTSRDIGKLRTTIQEQRDRAKAKVEAARVTEERGKLYRAVNEINRRLLNPTKTLYVPDSLAPAVTKFMQGLTEAMESPKNSWNVQGALETLQGQYQKLTQMNEGVFTQEYNQGILDLLDNAINAVGGTDFNKLSASQIEDVYSAVRSVLTAIRNENKMFAANLNKTYAEAAAAVLREESALPNRKPTTGAVQDKAEKFGWNQLKPVYAMMRLGSDTLLKQYNNLRAGEDKWQRVIAAARAYGLGTMAKYNYDQWDDSLRKLDTETGTVELSLEERMSLYAYARREQAFEHLTKGGFVLSDENTRTVKNRFGIETEQI